MKVKIIPRKNTKKQKKAEEKPRKKNAKNKAYEVREDFDEKRES